ncbi:hypothetical protein UB39_09260 [Photobacterium angustum]|nr:hypothetical protein UB39_09260 [Photobacterium angustum]
MQRITKSSLALCLIMSTATLTGCDAPAKEENKASLQLLNVDTYQLKQQQDFAIEREYVGLRDSLNRAPKEQALYG